MKWFAPGTNVTPAQARVQGNRLTSGALGSRFRGNDGAKIEGERLKCLFAANIWAWG